MSQKRDLLIEDLGYVREFLNDFSQEPKREIVLDKNLDWVILKNFPLPDSFQNGFRKVQFAPDYEDILLVTTQYPNCGPWGIHIKKDSPNDVAIAQALGGGHVYGGVMGGRTSDYASVVDKDWKWVCFHTDNQSWNFNYNNLRAGDCLWKYIITLFAGFQGKFATKQEKWFDDELSIFR